MLQTDTKQNDRLIFLAVGLVFLAYWLQLTVRYPVSYDIAEGTLVERAIAFVGGGEVYPAISSPPYYVTPYTPLAIMLFGGFIKLFGFHVWIGRVLSMAAFFGTMAAAAFIVRKEFYNYSRALLFMLLTLCSYHVLTNATTFNLQWFGAFFSIFGLLLVRRNLALAFFVMSLGIMAKQSQILAPAAALLWLLFNDRTKALVCGFYFVALVTVELYLCRMIFGTEFLNHILKYTVGTYDIVNLLRLFAYCLAPYFIFLGAAALAIYRRIKTRYFDLIFFYFVFNFLWLFATLRVGSDSKYFLEFYVALFMLIASVAAEARRMLVVQFVALCVFSVFMFHWNTGRVVERDIAIKKISQELKNLDGDIIFEDPSLAVASGKPLYIEPLVMSELARRGLWNQTGFLKSLDTGEFAQIILQFDIFKGERYFTANERFTAEMRDAIQRRYELIGKTGPFYSYRPALKN